MNNATKGALAAAAIIGVPLFAAPCDLRMTLEYQRAGQLCMDGMPDSRSECMAFLRELEQAPARTLDQSLALAFGRSFAALQEDATAQQELELISRAEVKQLLDGDPLDPMLISAYAYFHLWEPGTRIALRRRVVDVDPTCVDAAHSLALMLDHGAAATDPEELSSSLTLAYEHARGEDKLYFAAWKHRLLGDRSEDAGAFRARVLRDMDLGSLPLDDKSRAASLDVLCHWKALELRFEEFCLDALEQLAERDLASRGRIAGDVLDALGSVAVVALRDRMFGDDGAVRMVRLRDLLDAVPQEGRDAAYHLAYARAAGPARKVEALRRALALEPGSGLVGLLLASALEEARRPAEAAAAYRRVIADDDGRVPNGEFETYGETARQLLHDLQAVEAAPQ